MSNPYASLPDFAFWRRVVASLPPEEVDPVVDVPFRINKQHLVATAGSCFAQHISRTLLSEGFSYLVTETKPATSDASDEGYGVFPARFANVYTVRQLLQLFQRAYGLFEPVDSAWQRPDGAWVDPFRPRIQAVGFPTQDAVIADRDVHLAAVRSMFEQCEVSIFTLGLTECWASTVDGAVFPLAPGVEAAGDDMSAYAFHNCEVGEMTADLLTFIDWLRRLNPGVRIVLTVSPVPLVATYERRHVLVSTTYSKAALRVVADCVCRARDGVAYFPAYEIVTGPQAAGRFYEADLREIRPEGVAHVMSTFRRHFLADTCEPLVEFTAAVNSQSNVEAQRQRMQQLEGLICDEEVLDVPPPADGGRT